MPAFSFPSTKPRHACWISVDPGLSGTGVAIWLGRDPAPITVNISPRKDDWQDTLCCIVHDFRYLLDANKIEAVYYELPAFMKSATAANARQDIVKLTLLAGALHGISLPLPVTPVPIINWKGQVSKEMMNDRVIRRMTKLGWTDATKKRTTHELDAIGIGMYIQGLL